MRSWFFLFSCNLMWALQFTCIKLVQDQVGSLFTVWGPMTLATLLLIPLVRAEWKDKSATSKHSRRAILDYFLLAAFGAFPAQVLITWGTRMSLASNAALLALALPVCTAVMAFFILGERMTTIRWFSFALAILGVLMCSSFSFGRLDFGAGHLAGNALIFSGVLASSFYNSFGKRVLRRQSSMQMLFFAYVGMFILMTPLVLIRESDVFARIPSFPGRTWTGLALLAFFHHFLAMVLFLKALRRLDATQAALSNYLITFFGVPIAAITLGEHLSPLAIVGGVMMLASTLLITLRGREQSARPSEA